MKYKGLLYAFLGGAVVGGVAAILFAPEKGSDLRARIKNMLKERGFDFSDDDVSELVDQITAEIEDSTL
jgi:gas vesicle protein